MKTTIYLMGVDPYNWDKYKIVSSRISDTDSYFKSWSADLVSQPKLNSNFSWGAIVEIDFDTETFKPTYRFSYIEGNRKEYLELNKEAKDVKKVTRVTKTAVVTPPPQPIYGLNDPVNILFGPYD